MLYTPGPGEGGGAQRVFCAGRCPDGTACKLTEQLILKADGSKVYRLTCECEDKEDDHPNDDDQQPTPDRDETNNGGDANNNQDPNPTTDDGPNETEDTEESAQNNHEEEACCGEDAPAARPCRGYVQKIEQSNGIVTYQLICAGDCPGRAKCRPRSSRNHHGGVRQWCGCNNQEEPSTCHIVLYTPGHGEGGGAQRVFCAGACPDGSQCTIKKVLVHLAKDGTKVFRLTCVCKKKAAKPEPQANANPDDQESIANVTEEEFTTELDPNFVLNEKGDDEETNDQNAKLKKRQAMTSTMDLRSALLPARGEKLYQVTFEGVPESLYEVLVSEDMQQWLQVGIAEEIEPGRYGWVDDIGLDRIPRFYTLRPLYVASEDDLAEDEK